MLLQRRLILPLRLQQYTMQDAYLKNFRWVSLVVNPWVRVLSRARELATALELATARELATAQLSTALELATAKGPEV